MTPLTLLIALHFTAQATPVPASRPLVVFRLDPSPKADASLGLQARVKKLRREGFVSLEVAGVQAYAEPALLARPATVSVARVLGLLTQASSFHMMDSVELSPMDVKALSEVIASSPFAPQYRSGQLKGPTRVAVVPYFSADLDVDGRTIRISYDQLRSPQPNDPVAFKAGVDLPLQDRAMTVEWLGPDLDGPSQDDYTARAFGALRKRRTELRDALLKNIDSASQRAMLGESLPAKASRLSDLPQELQEGLRAELKGGFQALGFKTENEALDALENGRLHGFFFGTLIQVSNPGSSVDSAFGLRTINF